jgi:hypothetical protein
MGGKRGGVWSGESKLTTLYRMAGKCWVKLVCWRREKRRNVEEGVGL